MLMLSSFNLLAGKLYQAWRSYPQARRDLQELPSGPPIFITGTHRSGTTWVAAMLAIPGLWYVHEPFNPNKGLWNEHFTYVPENGSNREIDRLMRGLLQGRFRQALYLPWTEHCLMPLRFMPQTISRVLIKDPIACLMSEYLTRKFDLRTLVIFRHPAGFVSSLLRLGWPCTPAIRQLLRCRQLMEDWLSPYREEMESASQNEGVDAATVLCGCLNTVLWGFAERNSQMQAIFFEDLCMNPLELFEKIFRELQLPYGQDVQKKHAAMCFGAAHNNEDYRTHDVIRNSKDMAFRWRKEIALNELEKIYQIWNSFAIPAYKSTECW